MRPPLARWTAYSALLAPICLLAGLRFGAAQQGPAFHSAVDTISALAALGARERWIMTCALAALGLCHLATAAGLRDARTLGRSLFALGGVSTLLVAVFPLPRVGGSLAHYVSALSAFVCMSAWPLFASTRASPAPGLLRWRPSLVASIVMFALLGWFGCAIRADAWVGLSERALAVTQALWPLAVVLAARRQVSRL